MEEKIRILKEKLEKIDTRELLGMIGTHFITFSNGPEDLPEELDIFNKTKLSSPQKQYVYLAGLLMSTEDKSARRNEIGTNLYIDLENDVERITSEYIKNFMDIDIGSTGPNMDEVKRNVVSMEAFTAYFDTGILRYPEQTIDFMRKLYSNFDSELEQITGLTTEDYVAFYQLICDVFSEAMHSSKLATDNLKKFLYSFNPFDSDVESAFQRLLEYGQGPAASELQDAMDGLNVIKASVILQSFGEEKGNKLLELFCLYREKRNFVYYNGKNPFAKQPLCWIDEGESLFIVHPQFVLNAIYDYITEALENPNNKFADRYKKIKGEVVENLFLKCFKDIFGDSAKYHTSVCEQRGTNEHDILIEYEDYIIIAEAKASKVREPLFNPEKAYIRIRDHYNSDNGIGGAYKQAIMLKKFIEKEKDAILYENKNKKFVIENASEKMIIPVVLTLNQFGSLAVNTSLVIEKEDEQPFPWVCNWHDLDDIVEILQYLKKGPKDFIEYIVWRGVNHQRIVSSDELDIFDEYFLNPKIRNNIKGKVLSFAPNGPSIIDKIYFQKHGIRYNHPVLDSVHAKKKKIGRNDPCPCGSGNKFKRCCINKGIYN